MHKPVWVTISLCVTLNNFSFQSSRKCDTPRWRTQEGEGEEGGALCLSGKGLRQG